MVAIKDLTGSVFGRWSVIKRDKSASRSNMWICKCTCGSESSVNGTDLRNGSTKSCGCLRAEQLTSHGMHQTRFYSIWSNMISRCNNKNSPNYGGRGIKVCDEWCTFENFKKDLYQSYQVHLRAYGESDTTLDRIDVNGNYEPRNVKWSTMREQVLNRRPGKNNTSGYPGINFVKSRKKWRARITVDRKEHHLGMFNTLEEAILARESAIKQFEGER